MAAPPSLAIGFEHVLTWKAVLHSSFACGGARRTKARSLSGPRPRNHTMLRTSEYKGMRSSSSYP